MFFPLVWWSSCSHLLSVAKGTIKPVKSGANFIDCSEYIWDPHVPEKAIIELSNMMQHASNDKPH